MVIETHWAAGLEKEIFLIIFIISKVWVVLCQQYLLDYIKIKQNGKTGKDFRVEKYSW